MGQTRNQEIDGDLKLNENENKTWQTLWNTLKQALSGKYVSLSDYSNKWGRAQQIT